MWKNVVINFLVLSVLVFSGEYLNYHFQLKDALRNTPLGLHQTRANISGAWNVTPRPFVISGVNQSYAVQRQHISGRNTRGFMMGNENLPAGKVDSVNYLLTTSS